MGLKWLAMAFGLLLFNSSWAESVIRTIGPQSTADGSHAYYTDLLEQVIAVTEQSFGPARLELVEHPGQGRVIRLLAMNLHYDVMWTGTSEQREETLRAIKVPIFLGGLGIRGQLIHQDRLSDFQQVRSLSDLRPFIACQGEHWPDADVLEAAGLRVVRVGRFESMLEMLARQRCDYLPLSIVEGQAELDAVAERFPELVFFDQLLLRYPLVMYFFVHKDNTALAERIEQGMQLLAESGALLQFMQQHPVTQAAFPLSRYQQARVLELDNPLFKDTEVLSAAQFWLSLD